MPLFKKKQEPEKQGQPAYPTQSAAPPMSQPPPAYSQYPQAPPQGYAAPPPGYAPPPQGYAAAPPQGYGPPSGPAYYQQPQGAMFQPGQNVVVQGGFDAGARFDGIAQPNIPPPPPGCTANAAQMAAMQGSNVTMTQRPSDFFTGGSDGGYTMF